MKTLSFPRFLALHVIVLAWVIATGTYGAESYFAFERAEKRLMIRTERKQEFEGGAAWKVDTHTLKQDVDGIPVEGTFPVAGLAESQAGLASGRHLQTLAILPSTERLGLPTITKAHQISEPVKPGTYFERSQSHIQGKERIASDSPNPVASSSGIVRIATGPKNGRGCTDSTGCAQGASLDGAAMSPDGSKTIPAWQPEATRPTRERLLRVRSPWRKMWASAYAKGCECANPVRVRGKIVDCGKPLPPRPTKSGKWPEANWTIAAHPSDFPIGAVLELSYRGILTSRIVQDIGSDITRGRLDLYMADCRRADTWGRKQIDVREVRRPLGAE